SRNHSSSNTSRNHLVLMVCIAHEDVSRLCPPAREPVFTGESLSAWPHRGQNPRQKYWTVEGASHRLPWERMSAAPSWSQIQACRLWNLQEVPTGCPDLPSGK